MVFELERVPGSRHILSSQLIETSPLPPPGDCSIGAYGTKCRYLSGLRPSATWEVSFPFLSPPGGAKTRLRRVHYGPKIAGEGSAFGVVESNRRLLVLKPVFVCLLLSYCFSIASAS